MKTLLHNNFYNYINEKWILSNKIPKDQSIHNIFTITQKKINNELINIMTSYKYPLITKLYKMFTDIDYRNKSFIKDLKKIIKKKSKIKDLILDALKLIYIDINILFNIYVDINIYNNKEYIIYIGQPNLILPNRDYYLDDKFKNILIEYNRTIKDIYTYIYPNLSIDKINEIINIIFNIETEIAKILLNNDILNDIKNNNLIKIEDFDNRYKYLNIYKILESISKFIDKKIDIKSLIIINKFDDDYFKKLEFLIKKFNSKEWGIYFVYRIIIKYIILGDKYLYELHFNMFNRILRGQSKMKSQSYLALMYISDLLSDYISNIYYKNFLELENNNIIIEYTKDMINNIINGAKSRIINIEWLLDETKNKAIDKLNNINIQIGYNFNDHNYDIKKLSDNLLINTIKLIKHNNKYHFNFIDKPVDLNKWDTSCYDVNAYYNPALNQIVFPAAILQSLFININKSDTYNYGKLGAVIGHEIIHGFDNNGAKFDEYGNVKNWWNKKDEKKFTSKVNSIIKIYDNEGINGKLTAGENIADFGAVIMSLEGLKYKYKRELNKKELKKFYISYAKLWRTLMKDEIKNIKKLTDPHAYPDLRVNVPIKNQSNFKHVFNIKKNSKMYVDDNKILKIW